MKRNHIYVGGTVLLVLLGACGGYYVWAGSGDEGGPGRAKGRGETENGDDQSDVVIEVPPMISDEEFALPVTQDLALPAAEDPALPVAQNPIGPPPRYAANPQSPQPQSSPAYAPYPAVGGASALPPSQGTLAPAAEPGAAAGPDDAIQPGFRGGRYDAIGSSGGTGTDEIGSVNVAEEVANPQGAAVDVYDPASVYGSPVESGIIPQGDPAATGMVGDGLENALRGSAATAFTSDNDAVGTGGGAGRYAVAADSPAGGSGAPGAADRASPPAPILVSDSAEPLGGSSLPAGSPMGDAQSLANNAGALAGSGAPDLAGEAGTADGGLDGSNGAGVEVAADGAYSDNAGPFQESSDSGGYPRAGATQGTSPRAAGVGALGAAVAAEPFATHSQQQLGGTGASLPPREVRGGYNSNFAMPGAGTATSPYPGGAGGEGGQIVGGVAGTGRPGGEALEGPQAPQLSVEKTAPEEIQVGKRCTFTIVVRNTGRAEARQVQLVDEVPLGTQLVETSPEAAVVGSRLEWEFGTLAPGDSKTVEVELLPTEEGEIGSVATVHFAAAASARTHSTRPLLEVVAQVAPTVMIGEQQAVRITVKNPGTGDATGVMLLENVPDGMSHPHGPDLEFEVGTLRAGESRELELVLTAEAKGRFQNWIVATGDANLRDEDVAEFEVVAPDIAVSVNGPQRKYLELPATFVVAVENRGTAAAKDIELVGKLPEGLEFVSANNFGEYDEATRSVYWSLAELQPSRRGEVTLVAMPVDLGEKRLEFKAGADLGLVDHAESTLHVEGLAALKSEVTDVADPIEVGGQTSYEIRIVNQGSKAASNVVVLAQFPEGIEAVRAEGPTEGRVEPQEVLFSPLRELSPKADTTYRVDVAGVLPGDQRIRVRIMTDDLAQPINEEESTRVYADQ